MSKQTVTNILVYIVLIISLLLPRAAGLGRFATLDEPYWLSMGANFYYALGQREFENTVYEYQPAVTTMWIVTLAMLQYFPEYRGFGQGYLDFEKGDLDPFLLEHGKSPLELLKIARGVQVILIVLLFLILYGLLKRIIPPSGAFFVVLFASFDPFFLGTTRLLNHEGMVALFSMISVAAMIVFTQEHRKHDLIISATAAGLAQLTKSSSIVLLLPVGILFLMPLLKASGRERPEVFKTLGKNAGVWMLTLALVYVIFWPGMWTAPGKMLHEVYGNAFSYALQGSRLKVTNDLEPENFSLESSPDSLMYFVSVLFYRTTPITWLGLILLLLISIRAEKSARPMPGSLIMSTAVTAAAYVLLFALSRGRNSPHYILTSFFTLNLLAGLGWYYFLKRRPAISNLMIQAGLLLAILSAQSFSSLSKYPYYLTYRNPILYSAGMYRAFPEKGYGEGLELAAQYLATLPDAEHATALVYYSRGCFSYFYPGETIRFKPYYVEEGHEQELRDAIEASDYLVIYYAVQGKVEKYTPLLEQLKSVEPLHEIWMDGYKYAVIYASASLPPIR